jgi:hypothetical protein
MTGSTGKALWTQSIYENEFVKQDGVWKFKTMHVYPRFIVDAELGWAKDAQPAPGPSREFPPDRPPTETYEIYPRFHIAPLHFDHPVTGRPPQYPEGVKTVPRVPMTPPKTVRPVTSSAALSSLIASTELSVERSKAYHASENLATAYGYQTDESSREENADIFTIHQVVQPVIHVSPDARRAKIRMRLFRMGGPATAEGSFASGIYENTSVNEDGTWKLSGVDLDYIWSAPSRGGWVRVTTPSAPVPFHYKNPVSGRVPPLLLP